MRCERPGRQRPRSPLGPRRGRAQGFVAGRVELAWGERTAARVTVTQRGLQTSPRGNTWHQWEEVERTEEPRPFHLVLDSGSPPWRLGS